MYSLYKKELNYYLNNSVGYIILALFAVFANFLFVKDIFITNSSSLRPFFGIIPWIFLLFIPALSMRTLAEERRLNTLETLLSLPISETQIILAKFLSLMTLVSVGLALTLLIPFSLSFYSKLYLPEVFVGYLGTLLYGASLLALSMFFSSLTKNQVVAFLASALAIFFLNVLGTDFVTNVMPKFLLDVVGFLSPLYHLENFMKGVIDLRSVWYFCSFTLLFLFLSVTDLERRD